MRRFGIGSVLALGAMLLGGVSIRRAPATAITIHDDASPAPTPMRTKKPWTRRSPRFVPTLLPASFYQERAEAKRERKAEKLRMICRHWPQQQGYKP
ncbi:hypothetical protein ABE527_18375 [Brucella sp. TWI432]